MEIDPDLRAAVQPGRHHVVSRFTAHTGFHVRPQTDPFPAAVEAEIKTAPVHPVQPRYTIRESRTDEHDVMRWDLLVTRLYRLLVPIWILRMLEIAARRIDCQEGIDR